MPENSERTCWLLRKSLVRNYFTLQLKRRLFFPPLKRLWSLFHGYLSDTEYFTSSSIERERKRRERREKDSFCEIQRASCSEFVGGSFPGKQLEYTFMLTMSTHSYSLLGRCSKCFIHSVYIPNMNWFAKILQEGTLFSCHCVSKLFSLELIWESRNLNTVQ